LNGHQAHFHMLGGQQARGRLATFGDSSDWPDRAQLLRDPELAVARMKLVLALAGLL